MLVTPPSNGVSGGSLGELMFSTRYKICTATVIVATAATVATFAAVAAVTAAVQCLHVLKSVWHLLR